jgi:hypothetical protein
MKRRSTMYFAVMRKGSFASSINIALKVVMVPLVA